MNLQHLDISVQKQHLYIKEHEILSDTRSSVRNHIIF